MGRQSSWWPRPAPLAAVRLPHAADLTAARPPPQSMFAVGWMELKEPGRAWGLLERSFANITEPFKASLPPAPTSPAPASPRPQPPLQLTSLPSRPWAVGLGAQPWATAGSQPGNSLVIWGLLGAEAVASGGSVSGVPALTASPPPQVWTENSDGSGAVNFLTGMGGFLQAALFGFTGFR